MKPVSVLVAIGVSREGFREVLGVAEVRKEDKAGWLAFLRHLKQRGLTGTKLLISDACHGLVEAATEALPEALWQRCIVHFYRNVFTVVPQGKVRAVVDILKAIHAQEDKAAAREKAAQVVEKLEAMKLRQAASMARSGIEETLSYYEYPREHRRRIRTNNPLERIVREIRRRTRVVGAFPDGNSALMLVAARLRHITGTRWGTRRYLRMELLNEIENREEQVA